MLSPIHEPGRLPPSRTRNPTLSVRSLSKAFNRGSSVLTNVNMDVEADEAVALIGSNGTGKSTFVRCLLRLVEPTSGEIRFLDTDVMNLGARSLRQLRARVGFVFQRHNLVLRLSALSNVVHGAQARLWGPSGWYQTVAPRETRDEALMCLERVGLLDKATARADTLSGGQSQRVAVARMLMQKPDFVIADEPDASLDPKAGEEIMQLLRDTTRERGIGLLFISHDLEHAIKYSDRIVGLAAGMATLNIPAHAACTAGLRDFFSDMRAR